MPLTGTRSRTYKCLAGLLLALLGALRGSLPARADLYGSEQEYKARDYTHAFEEFLRLAQLGQPVAQVDVAVMYRAGQGTEPSDIHAYAWASLAARNGEPEGKDLADATRPQLAPGSERVAGWVTSAYSPAALEKSLLPVLEHPRPSSDFHVCRMVKWYSAVYPEEARLRGIDGAVFVDFTVMPDGSARFPRIIYAVPSGLFEPTVRNSVLRSRFGQFPADLQPLDCSIPYRFTLTGMLDWSAVEDYVKDMKGRATPVDPNAEFVYGLLLDGLPQLKEPLGAGLPWFVKAAQGGIAVAQYQVGFCLLTGDGGCRRDEFKALKWLKMAAAAGEPQSEVTLAMRQLSGTPGAADLAAARNWLDRAVESGNDDAKLFLAAILAAAPQPALRDPKRALELLNSVKGESDDPATFEIWAAAQGAAGDFQRAIRSEQKAIRMARSLSWDLAPLEQRLARYQSHSPWYGSLLTFSP